jgi:hypothetical protein
MATVVFEKKEMTLLDGTELSMGPLKISLLRKFMNAFDKITKVAIEAEEASKTAAKKKTDEPERSANDKSIDVLMECALIAMEQYAPGKYESIEVLEDVADIVMVYRIIEAASGIKLDEEGNVVAAGLLG